jgi:hypothetical protein
VPRRAPAPWGEGEGGFVDLRDRLQQCDQKADDECHQQWRAAQLQHHQHAVAQQ